MIPVRPVRFGAALAIATVIAAAGIGLSACAKPAPTAGPPVTEDTNPTSPAPAGPVAGQSGATLDVTTDSGSAAYTVGNLQAVPPDAQIIPARGAMYAVDVRVTGRSGTTTVNGFYFVAGTADGSTVAPAVGAVRPGITYSQLGEGQSVEGHVAFDVAPGASITAVFLRDPRGRQLAAWSLG